MGPWVTDLRHRFPLFDRTATKAESILDGVVHHGDVWREALALDRLRPKLGPRGEAELAFLPAALEITERPASTTSRLLALTLCALFAGSLAWASIGELDIVAVAQGKIIPTVQVQDIQATETAVVRSILVDEGHLVRKGDRLIELEVSGGQADVERLTADWNSARTDAARLEALLEPEPERAFTPPADLPALMMALARAQLAAQLAEHRAKLASLDSELGRKRAELRTTEAEISRLTQMEALIQDRTERRRTAAARGLGSELDRLKTEQELEETRGSGRVQRAKLAETHAAIDSLASQRDQAKAEFRRDATTRLAEARAKASSAENDLAKAAQRQKVLSLIAPVDGTVHQMNVQTVVQPAQKLLSIVPMESALIIEARLPTKDIAFVTAGQEAVIKLDAFPFTRYGTLSGHIVSVSRNTAPDEQKKEYFFTIRVALDRDAIKVENNVTVPLTPGMVATAEIRTGTRRPIEYVLAPLQKYKDESARER